MEEDGTDGVAPRDTIRAAVVEPKDLPHIWDRVAELLGPACEASHGQESLGTARQSLVRGTDGLFVVLDGDDIIGAVTYHVLDFETGLRLLDIPLAGGIDMDSQMGAVVGMFNHLKSSFMCDRVRVTGRKGWIRYMKQFGFVDTHYSVEME
jgi:hypothetical protein